MMIYCAHKYGGKEENKMEAEQKIRTLQSNDFENCYVSPVHTFGFEYNDYDYDTGMELCIDLLSVCDVLLVMSKASKGVLREIEFAELVGMPIWYLDINEWEDGMVVVVDSLQR